MPINRYKKAQNLLRTLVKSHSSSEIKLELLIMEIRKHIGDHPTQTVQPYLKLMRDTGLIANIGDSHLIKIGDIDGSS